MTVQDVFGLGDRAVARREDPDTSHEAADSVERIGEVQRAVLRVLRDGPRCDESIAQLCPVAVSPSGLRSRRAELVARGLVEWAGTYSLTSSGRRTRVWRLAAADPGRTPQEGG